MKTRKFLDVSRCSHAKQRQGNIQKKCAAIRPFVVFCFFLFIYEKKPNPRSEMWKIKLQKTVGNLLAWLDELPKIVHECNGHLEIFSQVKEISRLNLLFRTDILQKTVVGCPWQELWKTTIGLIAAIAFYISLLLFCMTTTKVKRLFIDSKANETFPLKFPECFSLI